MGKRFRPTASKLVERRRERDPKTSQIDIPISIDIEYLNKFLGRIFFWSFTIRKVKPHHHATKLRICTHRYVPKDKIKNLVEGMFPEGVEIKIIRGYPFRHTFDIGVPVPMRVDALIWRIVNALEGVL